jgi:hypothetical protein
MMQMPSRHENVAGTYSGIMVSEAVKRDKSFQ